MFDPVDRVDRLELSHTDTRVLLGNGMNLEATVWLWYAADRGVIWTSSDDSVATVDENGRVTARGLGECVITAASRLDPTQTAVCRVTTFAHGKTLQAIIWNEEREVWMSRFDTDKLPEYTKLDFEMETQYFGSAYFDGEMLYYSAYKESRDNVTLMAIDVAGGRKAALFLCHADPTARFPKNTYPTILTFAGTLI